MSTVIATAFPIHTLDTAPAGSLPSLQRLKQSVGAIPNLAAAMSGSPQLIEGFVLLREIFRLGTFTPVEREILALANAVENRCQYCRAIHSTFALQSGLAEADVKKLRAAADPADPKLAALAQFAREVLRQRGEVDQAALARFTAAGYTAGQALEVVLALAVSVMANYSSHLAHPPLDAFLQPQA